MDRPDQEQRQREAPESKDGLRVGPIGAELGPPAVSPELGAVDRPGLSDASSLSNDDSQLDRRHKLERESRRREEFMAMLGHELRNPLAVIANVTELLRRVGGPRDDRLNRLLCVLDRQTDQMRHIVDDLLDVARIAGGKIRLQLEQVDLAELTRAVAEDQSTMLYAKGLQLQLDIPASSVWVLGDRVRLTQVIQNLVDNGAKFTDPPGWVLLRLRNEEASECSAQLSVIDSGCGMDEEMLNGAFEPFRQADRTLERSRGGLGLGLPLVRGLIEMHGGRVEAFSDGAGCGTELRITLPRLATVMDQVPAACREAERRVRRILIVEDHEDSAETLRELLEVLGYEVQVAFDAASGLRAMERFRPELVLCDIGLPGEVSGYDLARQARAKWGSQMCLVALTGYGSRADQRRAAAAGFHTHMRKPLDVEELERFVLQWRTPEQHERT